MKTKNNSSSTDINYKKVSTSSDKLSTYTSCSQSSFIENQIYTINENEKYKEDHFAANKAPPSEA